MNRITAVGVAMLVIGVGLMAGGTYVSLDQEQRLAGLERVNGTVVSAEVDSLGGNTYAPNVTYRFEAGNRTYTSSRIFPAAGQQNGSREYATEVVGRYSPGQQVTVFYPPGEPEAATLRAPRSPTPFFAVGFGFVATAFGLLVAVAGRQRDQPPIETDEVLLPGEDPPQESEDGDEGDGEDEPEDDSGDDAPDADGA